MAPFWHLEVIVMHIPVFDLEQPQYLACHMSRTFA
jgi:hypothetical protein